jgi:hypothetical protein
MASTPKFRWSRLVTEKRYDPAEDAEPTAEMPGNEAGRLAKDELGNVTWEWKAEGDLLADDDLGTAERVRALVDPNLDLAEEPDDIDDPGRSSAHRLASGYNPYNSGPLGKQSWRKKKDLRELSKWIELRRKVSHRPSGDGDNQ